RNRTSRSSQTCGAWHRTCINADSFHQMPVTTPNLASELPANGNGIHQSTLKTDRRRRARFCLHWTARLLTGDQGWVEASILNISSDGFYCLSEIDLPVGAIMRCVIA